MKKNLKWIIFGILIVLVIGIMIFIKNGRIVEFDNYIYTLVTHNTNSVLDNLNHIFTFFGSTLWMIILPILCLIMFKDKKKAVFICVCLIISIILNIGIKNVFMRERPVVRKLVEETSYSFPSGHTTAAVTMYGIMLYLIIKSSFSKNKKIIFSSGLIILMFLVAVSRIYLGAHFASDVIGGALVSSAFLILYTSVTEKFLIKNKE